MRIEDDVASIAALLPGDDDAAPVAVEHGSGTAPSAFEVDRLLGASAAFCAGAVTSIDPMSPPTERIDLDHVRSFCTTHVEIDGAPVPGWAPLSGVYETADGRHVQVHCNFPHHADAVVRVLGASADRDSVTAAFARREAVEVETALHDAGAIAAMIRSLDEWSTHPHARATDGLPIVTVDRIGDARPLATRRGRVLDCSRVLAGPIAGQLLATAGADVMRLGAAHLPSVDIGVVSTGFGKRNADADLRTDAGRVAMDALLSDADVWIDAYRPGALAGHGSSAERAATLRPGIVIVQISAFDWVGPWAGRRGFDSIVQSTTGVRWAGGEYAVDANGARTTPGPTGLPVQALDYATGFLAAGVAARLVGHQRRHGGSWLARLSLLRTRNWLVSMGAPKPYVPGQVRALSEHLETVESEFGRVTAVTPFTGPWPGPPRRLGSSTPAW